MNVVSFHAPRARSSLSLCEGSVDWSLYIYIYMRAKYIIIFRSFERSYAREACKEPTGTSPDDFGPEEKIESGRE